jgi:casein kinase 1
MHDLGYIHRDLKPANIMMGLGKKENTVYLIDFGLTKKMGAISIGYQGANQISRKMAGTPIYSSINAHLANGGNFFVLYKFLECYKKDDLESMMYVLIQLIKGSLPW